MEKQIKLTTRQAEILDLIESTPDAELRPCRNPSGIFMYRLMSKYRPVQNIKAMLINALYNKDRLIKRCGYFYLKNPKQ